MVKKLTLAELQKIIPDSYKIENCADPGSVIIEKVAPLGRETGKALSFIALKKLASKAGESKACALLVHADTVSSVKLPALVVPDVELAMIQILETLHPPAVSAGVISQRAEIHPTAKIGANSEIGPFVSIGENAVIGSDSIIEAGARIGRNVIIGNKARIGPNCVFHDGVKIGDRFTVFGNSTFGADGFGFTKRGEVYRKIPQVGGVRIGNDVEIGANSCVDRGMLEDTVIGNGVKFDNQVHVGHNCQIGNNVVVAGQSGVAGSTILEDNVIIGGACAVSDHLTVPSGTVVAGGSCVRNTIEKPGVYVGWDFNEPFPDFQKLRVNMTDISHLHKHLRRIKVLEDAAGISDGKK